MHVLHFITSLKIGGAEAALFNFLAYCSELDSPGIKHSVVYIYDGPYVERIRSLGIDTYQLKGRFFMYDFFLWYRLWQLIKLLQPDIIHSALWSANIMARLFAWSYSIPLICDLHGDCQYHGLIRNFLERLSLAVPTVFVAVAQSVADSFSDKFRNKKLIDRLVVIPNGIAADRIVQRAENSSLSRSSIGLNDGDFVIGTVGRLHAIKRYDFLLRAFARFLSDSTGNLNLVGKPILCIVGDGPERARLEALSDELGLKKSVVFVGMQQNVYQYYRLFDCFVLSSQSEGLSIALLEALSFGLPIVTTHKSEEHDVIVNGEHGFVIPLHDEKGFAKALSVLSTNEALLLEMKRRNISLVNDKFHMRNVVDSYLRLYKKILKN